MTFSKRIALGVAAAAISLGVSLASGAFAEDSGKTDAVSNKDTMRKPKDAMSKDTMSKDAMGKDAMSKDPKGKDSMKKDEMTK
jgi:pentapeptide MXKDX repeat protein